METETITAIAAGIAWPISIVIVVLILRETISTMSTRLKGVEGPTGWKLLFEMRRVGDRLNRLESVTTDIYNISGEPLKVREEIFGYVANILKSVSESTAIEMRTELNKYHLERLPLKVKVSEIKSMLCRLDLYKPDSGDNKKFDEEISPEFIGAVYDFQARNHIENVDGIVGPKTIKLLLEKGGKDA